MLKRRCLEIHKAKDKWQCTFCRGWIDVEPALRDQRDRFKAMLQKAAKDTEYAPVQTWALELAKELGDGDTKGGR